jgi:hypothetical protein
MAGGCVFGFMFSKEQHANIFVGFVRWGGEDFLVSLL